MRAPLLTVFGLATLLPFAATVPLQAQDRLPFITYGNRASTMEGDDDYRQIIFFEIPSTGPDTVYVRLFDPDNGDAMDAIAGALDGRTRFALYGGQGAHSTAEISGDETPDDVMDGGTMLQEAVFGRDQRTDNQWMTFARAVKSQGDSLGSHYVFKLVVEGVAGDDGNVFDVSISSSPTGNTPVSGLRFYSYAPTIRLARRDVLAVLRFIVPENATQLVTHNYDVAGADVRVETAIRAVPVGSSDQGAWLGTPFSVEDVERGRLAAITMSATVGEFPNDAAFYVATPAGRALPIQLPVLGEQLARRPTVVLNANPLSDCSSVAFDAGMSQEANYEQYTFQWTFGDGTRATGRSIVHTYENPGTYQATVMVADVSGQIGRGAVANAQVVVKKQPVVLAGPDRLVAPGQPVSFQGSATTSSEFSIQRYRWDFNDGGLGQGEQVTHTFRAPGKYLVTLRAEDSADHPCNFGTDQVEVVVNAAPVAEAGENQNVSVGESLTLNGSRSYDTDGTIGTYEWDLGDGRVAQGRQIDHVYTRPGRFTVTLTVKDDANIDNSTSTDQIEIFVNDPPVAVAGADQTAAVGEVLAFNATSSTDSDGNIVNYLWDFGDGGIGNDAVVTYAYRRPGTYNVRLTVRDNSITRTGIGRDSLTVIINAPPIANAGTDQLVTSSEVQFDGTGSVDADGQVAQYSWDFGDGTIGSGPRPIHVYGRPGTYTVRLRVTDNSGTIRNEALDQMTVVVNAAPVADAGPDQVVSPGQQVAFDAGRSTDQDGSIEQFIWDFGDGSRGEGASVRHAYAKPGRYVSRLTVRDDTGQERAVDHDEAVIVVNSTPVAVAGPDVLVAPNQSFGLTALQSFDTDGSITAYRWELSDGSAAREQPAFTTSIASPGIYTARLMVTDDSGTENARDEDQLTVRVNSSPQAVTVPEITTCDVTIEFDGTASVDPDGDALHYSWDFGDGTPNTMGPIIRHSYLEGGTYPVVLTVNDGTGLSNASDTADMLVSINRPPLAVAGPDTTVCAGEFVIFDGSDSSDPEGGLLKFDWEFGDESTGQGVNPTTMYKNGGVYPVVLTVKDDSGMMCNTGIDQMLVRVVESPIANAGPDQTVCANMPVQFDGSGSRDADGVVDRFDWEFGDGQQGGGELPSHIYAEPGVYRVRLTITGDQVGTCDNQDQDEVVITVLAAPTAHFEAPERAPAGAPVRFDGSSSSTTSGRIQAYRWDFGDGNTGSGQIASHTFAEPGRYKVTLTIETDQASQACTAVSYTQFITINDSPVANAGQEVVVAVNEFVQLSGAGSTDSDGSIGNYVWDLRDGNTAQGIDVRHRYREPGRYPVVLTVTDDARLPNSTDKDTVLVIVNARPQPVIEVADQVCPAETVPFSAARSTDADGEIVSYTWEFGDGATAEGMDVDHTFAEVGQYHVRLLVDDGVAVQNRYGEATKVLVVNRKPMAKAGPFIGVCPSEPVAFDASASRDIDGEIASYRWNFADGQSADGMQVSHAFSRAGTFDVTLTVTDDSGSNCAADVDTRTVRVNGAPVANAGPDRDAFVGGAHDAVIFDAGGSSDPDGDSLIFEWEFGDGRRDVGRVVEHAYSQPGTYTVRLTARDGSGTSCEATTDTATVTVRTRTPQDGSTQ